MCVAFPNAGSTSAEPEPRHKRLLLLVPRLLALSWMLMRFLLTGWLSRRAARGFDGDRK